MNFWKTAVATILSVFILFPAQQVQAQHEKDSVNAEIVGTVPLLSDFHDVIYQIWHTAWPEKNVAMLSGLLPDVQRFADTLGKVELPGILRDKKAVWMEQVAVLRSITGDYARATTPVDSQKLLDAAERLHAQFEKLVRVTRPVLNELEEFHQVLYMIYHHYAPANDLAKIANSVSELKEKMAALNAARLSERMKKREDAFVKARTALSASVDRLVEIPAKENKKEFDIRLEKMHADYQAVEKVFE